MTDKTQQEMQEKLMLFQSFQAQLEELANHGTNVEARNIELEAAEDALNDIKKTKDNSEILVPLGAGCYGYGKLADRDNFMVEIGAGLAEKKNLQGAIEAIKLKKNEISEIRDSLDKQMDSMRASMDKIGIELQQMSDAQTKKEGEAPSGEEKKEDDGISVE
ncbi:MAG: prefoldin subunit alpha [Candidatus Aenigmarchaeota archaeon]|nr:prefoldin subunit alpha [Candidatus Aenigmarchaeota archaeon]